MNEELFLPYIRSVTEEDRQKLPRFSYSRIEQFLNCPLGYHFKYNKEMQTKDTSLALELGTLLHAVLEQKGYMIRDSKEVDYNILNKLITDGIKEENEKNNEYIIGIVELKKKYWESWSEPDTEGRTYDHKINLFQKVLKEEMNDKNWIPYKFEMPFEFVWDNRAIIMGFIDRVDINKDQKSVRVVDYKTSKKPFDKSKLPTSLQFGIYALACLNSEEINILPSEFIYRFVLIDDMQTALTKGWEKRLIKKLTQVFDAIEERNENNLWEAKACPLCYWCNYSSTNPNAHEYKDICDYYSLWTPTNKTFEKHNEWNALTKPEETKRKLIF